MSSEISLPNAGADVTVMGFATNYRRDGRLQICLAGAALRLRPFADRTHPPPENTATKKQGALADALLVDRQIKLICRKTKNRIRYGPVGGIDQGGLECANAALRGAAVTKGDVAGLLVNIVGVPRPS